MTDYPAQPPQQPAQPPAARPGAGMAITALVLGILALLLFWTIVGGVLFGLIALILGPIASGRAKRGVASGRGMAITGAVLGLLGLVASVALVALGATLFTKSGGKTYVECVQNANGDEGKLQKCADDFGRKLQNNN